MTTCVRRVVEKSAGSTRPDIRSIGSDSPEGERCGSVFLCEAGAYFLRLRRSLHQLETGTRGCRRIADVDVLPSCTLVQRALQSAGSGNRPENRNVGTRG